jgi:BirA family biotin operon repressor/biotin-[acetyl-CoA-carboxylase] ligase
LTAPAFTHLGEVGSTNDWLLERAVGLADEHWVIADRQTAGRGRRGRAWGDGAGNLMASVMVRANGAVQQLSFVAALALLKALEEATGQGSETPAPRFFLKWPNDVLLDGTKVSGILLERAGNALVIGFGANLAQFPGDTERPATSLAAAGLPVPTPMAMLARLMPAFVHYRLLWEDEGFEAIRTRWLSRAAGLGYRVTARLGTETLEGRFEGLAADGALTLRTDDDSLRAIHAGEVFAL